MTRARLAPLSSLAALLACGLTLVVGDPPARAASSRSTSSNWAGYAASRSGVRFRAVSASWTQPAADCSSGGSAYASMWIGLGGYHTYSSALEQIGTDAECGSSGTARYTAWYELVPAASVTVPLTIKAGDQLSASVQVHGHSVRLRLSDLTRGTSYVRTVKAAAVDLTSAEWIMEAPSLCISATTCRSSDLANFGTATFTSARATNTGGHTGTISDAAWSPTAIDLRPGASFRPGGPRFGGIDAGSGTATTSDLSATGSSFTITYSDGSSSSPSSPTGQQGPSAV